MRKTGLRRIKYALFGTAVGFLSAALGIGGGVLFVPVMVLFLGFDIKKAAGSSLAALVPIALFGAVAHVVIDPGHLQKEAFVLTVFGAAAGAWLGMVSHRYISSTILGKLFGLLIVLTSLKFSGMLDTAGGSGRLMDLPEIYMPLMGLGAGLCSSFFGIGGGSLFVPGFYFLFSMPLPQAIGTSLALIVPTALVGSFFHYRNSNVDTTFVARTVPAALAGCVAGAFASGILPVPVLKMALAVFLFVSGVKMLFRRGTATVEQEGHDTVR
jgi:hypothetical protein